MDTGKNSELIHLLIVFYIKLIDMKLKKMFVVPLMAAGLLSPSVADACTGITLKSKDGATVVARTIEWGGSDLNSPILRKDRTAWCLPRVTVMWAWLSSRKNL